MQISTGASANLRNVLRNNEAQFLLPELSTASRITNRNKGVFVELRERGAGSCLAESLIDIAHVDRRRRHYGFDFDRSLNIIHSIASGEIAELYTSDNGNILNVKRSKLLNVTTPYVLCNASNIGSNELFFSTVNYAIISTIERRRAFTQDVYRIAISTNEAAYKVCALKAMEQYFIALITAKHIDMTLAEKKYALYDKLQELIWRGGTPGEQVAAFRGAWKVLASVTNIQEENGQ